MLGFRVIRLNGQKGCYNLGHRAKETLLVDFIQTTDLNQIADKVSVIDTFFQFAQIQQKREAQALIESENLNAPAAKRYIATSLKREFASENGTELNAILPKISPLNPEYLQKKTSSPPKNIRLCREI